MKQNYRIVRDTSQYYWAFCLFCLVIEVIAVSIAAYDALVQPDFTETVRVIEGNKPVEFDNATDWPEKRNLADKIMQINPQLDRMTALSISACAVDAGSRHGVPARLIVAICAAESMFDERAVSQSNDFGIMQINANPSWWLPELERFGIYSKTDLLSMEKNIEAGAYILSVLLQDELDRALLRYNGLNGKGYADRVKKYMERI